MGLAREELDDWVRSTKLMAIGGALAVPDLASSHRLTLEALAADKSAKDRGAATSEHIDAEAVAALSPQPKQGQSVAASSTAAAKNLAKAAFSRAAAIAHTTTKTVGGVAVGSVSALTGSNAKQRSNAAAAAAMRNDADETSRGTAWAAPPADVLAAEATQLMESRQQQDAAAKQIEASVHGLSVLTGIMGDHVTMQAEQIATIHKHTQDAKASLEGGTKELRKPLDKKTWNATWVMIAFLWLATAVVLAVHTVLR